MIRPQPNRPTHRHGGAAPVVLVALLVVGVVIGVVAYRAVRDTTDPTTPTLTEADWQMRQMELEERLNTLGSGDPVDALFLEIKAMAAETPLQGPAQRLLGQAALLKGDGGLAYASFAASLRLDPAQPELEQLAGTAAFKLDRYDDAVRHYQQAMDLRPNDPELRVYLAGALIERNQADDREQGLRLITEALTLDDTMHTAYYRLSGLRLKDNHAEGALEAIDAALARLDRYAEEEAFVLYTAHRAKVLMRLRRYEEAQAILLRHPDAATRETLEQIAACDMQLGQPEQAARRYEVQMINVAVPPAWQLERAAHWWLVAGDQDRASSLIATYAGHPDADTATAESLRARAAAAAADAEPDQP